MLELFRRIMREDDSNWFAGWEKELPSQLQLPSSQANSRVVWSQQLHERFLDAVEHLGINHAVPKRIMELKTSKEAGSWRKVITFFLHKTESYEKLKSIEFNLHHICIQKFSMTLKLSLD
ncbi:hypothetical protein IGI04_011728 [Brassica rapa subsp. trilocularis]|uniref:Uncharacterized protein n=1 Tax=Brassica rapa subsp. trilocularis TaxID=1813537 RepID=A0ABQ7N3X6_BRACM|nr:hypothetical protein IGI04_011728 [Brassica rapa subsp. trilocularis]